MRWRLPNVIVSVYRTPNIVTHPPPTTKTKALVLVNPGNEQLCGAQASYVARGVPVAFNYAGGWASSGGWGGMDAGDNMLYRAEAVDGVVTSEGGRQLRALCERAKATLPGKMLPVGQAVMTVRRVLVPFVCQECLFVSLCN